MKRGNSTTCMVVGLVYRGLATIALTLSLGDACTDSLGSPLRLGALVVSAPATGKAIPASGGTVTVDDTAPRPLPLNGTATYAALAVGVHVVAFNGLQTPNCVTTDSNSVTVTVVGATTAHAAFPVECFGVGSIEVVTTTTGVDLDADGYGVSITSDSLGGWNTFLPPNDSTTLTEAREGSYRVTLNGIAPNCAATASNPTSVTVVNGQTVRLALVVTCVGFGAIQVTATTSGADLDPDGYTLDLGTGSGAIALPANGSATFAQVAPGTHNVILSGLSVNCSVVGADPVSVTVAAGDTTQVQFAITCVAFGAIQVSATTSGDDLDQDGYTATADLASGGAIAVPTNGSATFTQVAPGTQNVTLSGLSVNCSVVGANPISVSVASSATAQVQFAIHCAPVIPPGSAIAFTSLRDGNAEVYVLRAGASFTAVNLTNNAGTDSAPAWAPDGRVIAFATTRDLDDEIYAMNADGSGPVNLTRHAGSDQQPAWSPDGSKIAFVSTRNDKGDSVPTEIYVMASDGSGARTALTANSGGSMSPAWSPDGSRIAFVTVRDGDAEIYVMNADGSAPINLTHDAATDDHPVWSPDGTRIAFVSDRGGSTAAYVMRADGTGLTVVASGAHEYVSWSPDGTRLALTSAGIAVAYANGSGSTQLVADVPTQCVHFRLGTRCSNASASTPAWSPDGTRLVYHLTTRSCGMRGAWCTPANPQSSIRIMNPDGTGTFVLTSEAGVGAIRPVWKP